jgi:tetratricopeptide (TPR) repeat protein
MAAPREIEKLENQYRDNPEGTAFAPLANAHRKRGNPERAIEILHAGLTHHPEYAPARIVLGRCHVDMGDDAAAETEFIRVLELDGENVIALEALANIAERDNRHQDSEGWLNTLLSLDGGNDRARQQLARVAAGGGTEVAVEDTTEDAEPAEHPEAAIPSEGPSLDEGAAWSGFEPTEPFDAEPTLPADDEPVIIGAPEVINDVELEAVEQPADLEPLPELDAAEPDESRIIEAGIGSVEVESLGGGDLETWDLESAEPADPGIDDLGLVDRAAEESIIIGESEAQLDAHDESATAFAAGIEVDGAAGDEPPVEVEEEEGDQEGDETPAVLSELTFEDDIAIGSLETEPTEGSAATEPERPPFEEMTQLEPADKAMEPKTALPDAVSGGELAEPEPEPEPEPVATETMAELYLSQGHRLEALGIYRLLLAEQPDDVRLKEKVAALEEEDQRPASPRDGVPSDYAATSRGGQSIAEFFRVLLASRPDTEAPHAVGSPPAAEGQPLEAAEPSDAASPSAAGSLGEPTRPAHDRLLLSSVFGEDTSPVPPAMPSSGAGGGASTGRFSFDAFFGGQRGESVQPPEAASGGTRVEEEDLDQFQAWLQSLKG